MMAGPPATLPHPTCFSTGLCSTMRSTLSLTTGRSSTCQGPERQRGSDNAPFALAPSLLWNNIRGLAARAFCKAARLAGICLCAAQQSLKTRRQHLLMENVPPTCVKVVWPHTSSPTARSEARSVTRVVVVRSPTCSVARCVLWLLLGALLLTTRSCSITTTGTCTGGAGSGGQQGCARRRGVSWGCARRAAAGRQAGQSQASRLEVSGAFAHGANTHIAV